MPRRSLPLAAAALVGLSGCPHTRGAQLRVRPPAVEPGDPADGQLRAVEDAVRDVASMGRLRCERPATPRELLACWPEDLTIRPMVSLHLATAEGGYEVGVLASDAEPRLLCAIQERLVERLAFRLGVDAGRGVVERDLRVSCPSGAR